MLAGWRHQRSSVDAPKSLVSGTLGDCKNVSIARSAPESNVTLGIIGSRRRFAGLIDTLL